MMKRDNDAGRTVRMKAILKHLAELEREMSRIVRALHDEKGRSPAAMSASPGQAQGRAARPRKPKTRLRRQTIRSK